MAVTYFDITTRVEAEAEMRRLATVTRDSNDAVTVQALDGRILVWNRGAERIMRRPQRSRATWSTARGRCAVRPAAGHDVAGIVVDRAPRSR